MSRSFAVVEKNSSDFKNMVKKDLDVNTVELRETHNNANMWGLR